MAERFWIQELLSHGHNLTNATSGGDGGIPGYRHTPEAKALMSASRKSQPPLSEEERVKKRKLTPEQDTMVAEMYAAGATTRALSKAFGVSRPIIVKTIERLGVSMRSSTAATALYYARGGTRHAKTADHQQTICALYLAGHSAAKIGAKLSVHETTVLKVLKQIGITRRKAGGIYATPPATP
jgi:DNA invertase Pin-like site-specific DNA recombinase